MPEILAEGTFDGWFEWCQFIELFKKVTGTGDELKGPVGTVKVTQETDGTIIMLLEMIAVK